MSTKFDAERERIGRLLENGYITPFDHRRQLIWIGRAEKREKAEKAEWERIIAERAEIRRLSEKYRRRQRQALRRYQPLPEQPS